MENKYNKKIDKWRNVGVRAKEGEFKDDVNLKVQMWNGCKYNGFTVRQVMGSSSTTVLHFVLLNTSGCIICIILFSEYHVKYHVFIFMNSVSS